MKKFPPDKNIAFFSICLTGCLLTIPVSKASPDCNDSGIKTIDLFHKDVALTGQQSVVGMIGFYGKTQPEQWLVLVVDRAVKNHKEYVVNSEGVVGKRVLKRNPGADIPSVPIDRSRLLVDSDAAFNTVDKLAREAGKQYHSVHYQLRGREGTEEPVWMLNLLNSNGAPVGIHYISAESGKVLRSKWQSPAGRSYASSSN